MKTGMAINTAARRTPTSPRAARRRLNWRKFMVFVGVLYFLFTAGRVVVNILVLERQIQVAEQQLALAKAQQQQYQAEIAYRQTDAYVEKVAREELGMVKPGEIPYITTTQNQDQADRR